MTAEELNAKSFLKERDNEKPIHIHIEPHSEPDNAIYIRKDDVEKLMEQYYEVKTKGKKLCECNPNKTNSL